MADTPDGRRRIPSTDALLAELADAPVSRAVVRQAAHDAQARARAGEIAPEDVAAAARAAVGAPTSLRRVLNATGVVLHTGLGRAALPPAAIDALVTAGGHVDVELDLATGTRGMRGRGALDALRAAVPAAEDVHVVGNGAAALVLATTALAAGREVVVSRGELVEVGAGFRLHELVASTGARLVEVGSTNRTTLSDYAAAVGPATGCVLKVHPSNYRVEGFTASVDVAELARLDAPVVVDVGSGLLAPDPLLPDEPDVASALEAGAAVVTCSGDKLLGGPQAGLVLGRREVVAQLRQHPLARALRVDKLTLAALEAVLRSPSTPTRDALTADPEQLRARCARLAELVGGTVVAHEGRVGGGSAPGVVLAGYAVAVPAAYAAPLRTGRPPVVGHVERDRLLLDLRCVAPEDDLLLADAVRAVAV